MENINFLQFNSWLWMAWTIYWMIASRFVRKTASSESFLLRISHLMPLALGFILIFNSNLIGLKKHEIPLGFKIEAFGTLMTALGLLFAVWGRIHLGKYWSGIISLKEGHQLIRTGPYRLVRHPLYTGFLGGVLGSTITAHTVEAGLGFFFMVIAYLIKIRREETLLTQQFGEEYLKFKRAVKKLIPYVL